MKAKIPALLLLVLWGVFFVLGAKGKDDALSSGERFRFFLVQALIEARATPLALKAVTSSLQKGAILGDHLALLLLERLDIPQKERERVLALLERFFPESPVLFHAALSCARKEHSFSFALLALHFSRNEEEKLAAFKMLFTLLKDRGYTQEAALLLARMYRDFKEQTVSETRRMLEPLLPSLIPESFSPSSRFAFAEFLLSLGFLEDAEKFATSLEDAFRLKARLFLRKGDLRALEKLLEGRKDSEDVLFFQAVLAQRRGKYRDALALYERLLASFPKSPYTLQALTNIAFVHRIQGRKEEYIRTLERAVDLFPQNGSLLWELFFALYEEKDFPRAQSVLHNLAQLPEWRNQALFWNFTISGNSSYLRTILEESHLDYYYVRACQILGPASPFEAQQLPSFSTPASLKTSWAKYRFLSFLGLSENAEIELLFTLSQDPKNAALLLEASRFFAQRGLYRKSLRFAARLFPKEGKIPEFAGKGYYPLAFFKDVKELASRQNPPLDPYLVLALVHAESAFDPEAVSIAGAVGLAQVMPSTASWVLEKGWVRTEGNVEDILRIPKENLAVGIAYLAYLFRRFEGNIVLALCGYNAGPGRAEEWKNTLPPDQDAFIESIPFAETKNYVKKVLTNYFAYTVLYRGVNAFPGTF